MRKSSAEILEVPEVLQSSYLPSLDGLRAISIVIVIIAHLDIRLPKDLPPIAVSILQKLIHSGGLGVYIFFVISGFLITTLLLKEKSKSGTINLRNFYIRRFFRIIPLAYLFLIVLFICNSYFSLKIAPIGFVGIFFFLTNFGLFNTNKYSSHLWSLAYEEQFYLTAPFFLKKGIGTFLKFQFVLFTTIIIVRYFDFGSIRKNSDLLYRFQYLKELVVYSDGLMMGSLCSIMLFKKTLLHKLPNTNLLYKIALFVAIFYLHADPIWGKSNQIYNSLFSSALICLFLVSNLYPSKDFIFKFLNLKFIRYIGTLSYSLYIWQQLFTIAKPWEKSSQYTDSVFLNLVMLLIVTNVSYFLFEKKFLVLKERFKS